MDIVYAPNGGEEQRFEIDPEEFDLAEIKELETLSGKPFHKFMAGLGTDSVGDLRPLIYVLLKRGNAAVAYRDVRPKLREIRFEQSLPELEDARATAAADKTNPLREQVLAALDDAIAEKKAAGASGKGGQPSRSSASPTRPSRRSGKTTA